jgi:hypothetical protein
VGLRVADWTALDESNVRKAFNRVLTAAELDQRGPHQMRHTFASHLLQDGAPITYVRRQLGHKDAAITLRVYAHWLPDGSRDKLVNLLDDTHLDASQTHPAKIAGEDEMPVSAYASMVSRVGIAQDGEPVRRSRVTEADPDQPTRPK